MKSRSAYKQISVCEGSGSVSSVPWKVQMEILCEVAGATWHLIPMRTVPVYSSVEEGVNIANFEYIFTWGNRHSESNRFRILLIKNPLQFLQVNANFINLESRAGLSSHYALSFDWKAISRKEIRPNNPAWRHTACVFSYLSIRKSGKTPLHSFLNSFPHATRKAIKSR